MDLEQMIALSAKDKAQNPQLMRTDIDFIIVAQANSRALKPTVPDRFIPGLTQRKFYTSASKKILGDRIEIVPLGYETIFSEKTPDENGGRVISFWSRDDALKLPVEPGREWNHLNGANILSENVWIPCVVLGEKSGIFVLSFKSTALKIARAIRDEIAKAVCLEQLRIELSIEDVTRKGNAYYQLKVEEISKNFLIGEDGRISSLTLPNEELEWILGKGKEARVDMENFISPKLIDSLIEAPAPAPASVHKPMQIGIEDTQLF